MKQTTMQDLITVVLPTYQSKIVWFAMESLCRQENTPAWELIICEDVIGANGEGYFEQYHPRLKAAGCARIKYIPVSFLTTTTDRFPLSLKWIEFVQNAGNNSRGLMLQDSDDYSHPSRIARAYKELSAGYDWIHSRYGYFYNIKTQKTMLFDLKSIPTDVGIGITISMSAARTLEPRMQWTSINTWIYNTCQALAPSWKIYTELNDYSLYTDGMNIISKARRENYDNPQPPFVKSKFRVQTLLPDDIYLRLKNIKDED